jgi:hypothetical protein
MSYVFHFLSPLGARRRPSIHLLNRLEKERGERIDCAAKRRLSLEWIGQRVNEMTDGSHRGR